MQEWIQQIFQSGGFTVLMFPAAFVLGLVTALGSGCNVAALAAVAGYSARIRDKAHISGIYFSLGFIVRAEMEVEAGMHAHFDHHTTR